MSPTPLSQTRPPRPSAKDARRPPQPKMKVRAPQYIRARTTKRVTTKGK